MAAFSGLGARLYKLLYGNHKSNRAVVDVADLQPSDIALDVGCGPGAAVVYAASIIAPEQVSAVDPTPKFVDMVRKRVPGADVRVGDAEAIPFADATFTVIWSMASMHHWDSRESGLKQSAAKLAPGGRLLVAERLLTKPGHGITDRETAEVVTYLRDLGGLNVDTVDISAGRTTYRVVRAVKE